MTPADDHSLDAYPDSGPEYVPASAEEEAAFLRAVENGIADGDAGRTVSSEAVRRWIESWNTPNELPMPEPE